MSDIRLVLDIDERDDDTTHQVDLEKHIPDYVFDQLNARQEVTFRELMRAYYSWMRKKGEDIENRDGLDESTATNYLYRVTCILTVLWTEFHGYTPRVTTEQGD